MDHLATASNIITVFIFVIGAPAAIWYFARIPHEIDAFVEELTDINHQVKRFRNYWKQFKSHDHADAVTKTTAVYMETKLDKIVELSNVVLGKSNSSQADNNQGARPTSDDSSQPTTEVAHSSTDVEALQPDVVSTAEPTVRWWHHAWRGLRNRARWVAMRKSMMRRLIEIKDLQNQLVLSYVQILAE